MKAPVTIGDLRHRVSLEMAVRTSDGGGGFSIAWTSIAEVWAAIRPRGGEESFDLDRVAGSVAYDIWLRYRAGVTPQLRVRFGDRVFDIRAVENIEGRGQWLKCEAEERDL